MFNGESLNGSIYIKITIYCILFMNSSMKNIMVLKDINSLYVHFRTKIWFHNLVYYIWLANTLILTLSKDLVTKSTHQKSFKNYDFFTENIPNCIESVSLIMSLPWSHLQ